VKLAHRRCPELTTAFLALSIPSKFRRSYSFRPAAALNALFRASKPYFQASTSPPGLRMAGFLSVVGSVACCRFSPK